MIIEFTEVSEGTEERDWFSDSCDARSGDEHHWFVSEDLTPIWQEEYPEWDGTYEDGDDHFDQFIEHPDECFDADGRRASCGVAYELENVGWDSFGPLPQKGGRWRIQHWVRRIDLYGRGTEWDAGIEWIDDPCPT